ncbi:hypothetical protein HQ865_19040 [Mucilaginibacter mali]|uniref:Uncharacterized protein n=1 Tax=Mucilaginibacter mali TaxID=2740462 RepID=A0A7D4QH84_9SPHI|nr:hypothetical protein [Mucilaginibacter mali]QKJ31772.1 hypothetical protein HQ865_19040 [Mucilaginibacter mali]
MKKLLLFCIPLALLFACDKAHKTELINDGGSDSLVITSVRDTFNKFKSSYYVNVMLKNTAKTKAEGFVVTAKYMDQTDGIVAESSGGAGKTLAPGDSLLIENSYSFSSMKELPYKVKVSAKKMF